MEPCAVTGDAGGKRLDGWKQIANYFGRDRTTVMRWARDRGLPVQRLPGGKQGSVFALEKDLAAWALRGERDGEAAVVTLPPSNPGNASRRLPWRWMGPAIGVGIAAAIVVAATRPEAEPTRDTPVGSTARTSAFRPAMPRDPAVAAEYVAARELWEQRSRVDITSSIDMLQKVIRSEADFAPAHAALADAWLVKREYGDADDPTAFAEAERAARHALRLDPHLPSAHRALGFVDYWWNNRGTIAMRHFEQAIRLNDTDPQTHFWYANVLADAGESARAEEEYRYAKLLSPGSRTIAIEYAYAQWLAHRDTLALDKLRSLANRYPDDANVHLCLSWVLISRGDIVGFSKEFSTYAALREEPALSADAAALAAVVKRDPHQAVQLLIAQYRRQIATGNRTKRETPAFYASSMGDRDELFRLLTEASRLNENWYSRTITSRIRERWHGDDQIIALLDNLQTPKF